MDENVQNAIAPVADSDVPSHPSTDLSSELGTRLAMVAELAAGFEALREGVARVDADELAAARSRVAELLGALREVSARLEELEAIRRSLARGPGRTPRPSGP